MYLLLTSCLFLTIGGDVSLQRDIDLVLNQGTGSVAGRAAWERLSQAKVDTLPRLLEGMNTGNTVAANWLRTAFDQIVERESKNGKKIDPTSLLAFVQDTSKNGRARRFALEMVERLQPGTSEKMYLRWLDDPEFRYEAVALVLARARKSDKTGLGTAETTRLYREAYEKSRDVQQAREAAAGLQTVNVEVSLAQHFGFLTDWYLIGPFDGMGQKSFHLSYPPEKKVDLSEELEGQEKKIRWKRYHAKEAAPKSGARHLVLIDFRDKKAIGDADDAVAYAYTEFSVANAMQAEMRGSADDNLTVWVNGVKVFGFEEWRNGVRFDRHQFAVKLNAGKNTVLVKVCQSQAPNPEPNWEFFLRVVDATGKGIAMKNLLK